MGPAARSCAGMLAAALVCALLPGSARAAEIERLSVRYADALDLDLRALIDAPVPRVAAVLDSPHDLALLLPGARSVRVLAGAPAGARRLRIRLQGCLLFFCPSLTDVMDLHPDRGGFVGITVPALSDFSDGRLRWRYLAAPGGRTQLVLRAHLVPKIWVPPVIGPFLIEAKVRRQLQATVRRLERAARGEPIRRPSRPAPVNIPGFNF